MGDITAAASVGFGGGGVSERSGEADGAEYGSREDLGERPLVGSLLLIGEAPLRGPLVARKNSDDGAQEVVLQEGRGMLCTMGGSPLAAGAPSDAAAAGLCMFV